MAITTATSPSNEISTSTETSIPGDSHQSFSLEGHRNPELVKNINPNTVGKMAAGTFFDAKERIETDPNIAAYGFKAVHLNFVTDNDQPVSNIKS